MWKGIRNTTSYIIYFYHGQVVRNKKTTYIALLPTDANFGRWMHRGFATFERNNRGTDWRKSKDVDQQVEFT